MIGLYKCFGLPEGNSDMVTFTFTDNILFDSILIINFGIFILEPEELIDMYSKRVNILICIYSR